MSTTAAPVPAPTPPLGPTPSPPPTLKPTFDKHLDAVKWVIGLPVAILFGTTQFVDKIDFGRHPEAGQLLTAIVIVSSLTTVLSVFYYFLRIKLADFKILSEPTPWSIAALSSISYYGSLLLFLTSFVLTVIGLILYPRVQPDKTPPPTAVAASHHFIVTTSGPVKDRAGTHVHTFLVDQDSGEVWRMECSSTTGVHFVRVPIEGLTTGKTKPDTKVPAN